MNYEKIRRLCKVMMILLSVLYLVFMACDIMVFSSSHLMTISIIAPIVLILTFSAFITLSGIINRNHY